MFSHRRFFGRIDISSKDNPSLEDKSSREGLIENIQFYFFMETLKNLLIRIAVEFLGGTGIRKSYIDFNERASEMKKSEEEKIKQQREEIKNAISNVKQQLKESPAHINKCADELERQKKIISDTIMSIEQAGTIAYAGSIYNKANDILNLYNKTIKNLSGFAINLHDKYLPALDDKTTEELLYHNSSLDKLILGYNKLHLELKNNALEKYHTRIENLKNLINELSGTDIIQCKKILLESIDILKNKLNNLRNDFDNILNKKYKDNNLEVIKGYIDDASNNIITIKQELLSDINQKSAYLRTKIDDAVNRIYYIEDIAPERFIPWFTHISNDIDEISNQLNNYENEFAQKVENRLSLSDKGLKMITELISNKFSLQDTVDAITKRNIILEKENEILTDLANVGLAAEVVDHEFNQYFANVTNALSKLKSLSLQPTGKYLLQQIDTGFKAISNRHSQLSPMYRSYNYKRKYHKVIDVVRNVTYFYSASINKNNIDIRFDIDNDNTIFVSTSKIYPALSNLLNNAIFWSKSKGEKQILWRFDCKKHSLYIEDTGPGITERLKDKVFELFFSLKPSGAGRGMGLYLTRKILETEGHTIDIIYDINEKRLDGACFRVTFKEENK